MKEVSRDEDVEIGRRQDYIRNDNIIKPVEMFLENRTST